VALFCGFAPLREIKPIRLRGHAGATRVRRFVKIKRQGSSRQAAKPQKGPQPLIDSFVRSRLCVPFPQLGSAYAIDDGPFVVAFPSKCTAPPRPMITHGVATGSRWLHLPAKTSALR
jgi:hypothetical protein